MPARLLRAGQTTMVTEPADDTELFLRYLTTRDRRVRNEIVERYLGLAHHIAGRYRRAGHDDDIRQAAVLGLVKAVDRFDPQHGSTFTAFAGPTIEGELKRYMRDRTWAVRVPRSAKELHLAVQRSSSSLRQRYGRSPTVAEIGADLGIDRDEVLRGMAASAAYDVGSIDAPREGARSLEDSSHMATDDVGFGHVVDAALVEQLLDGLPPREREIVRLRFYREMSQSEIAAEVGISQMHVSRLLRQSFERMRAAADGVAES